jgi:hypothetical protein
VTERYGPGAIATAPNGDVLFIDGLADPGPWPGHPRVVRISGLRSRGCDLTSPRISAARLSQVKHVTGHPHDTWSIRLTYRLSESARVTVQLQEVVRGRRAGSSCRRGAAHAEGRPCRALIGRARIRTSGKRGRNSLRIGPRVGERWLGSGSYVIRIRAVDPSDHESRRVKLRVRALR